MFQTRHTCPHCCHMADFIVVNIAHYDVCIPSDSIPAVIMHEYDDLQETDAYGTACCPMCAAPVMFIFRTTWQVIRAIIACSNDAKRIFRQSPPNIRKVYPERIIPQSHPSYPADVKELFDLAQELAHDKKLPAMIVGACGSVLEVSLKVLGAKGSHYKNMIDDCLKQGIITRPLADWFHHLRIERNQAIHEIKASRKDADEVIAFLLFFLQFAFVIPAEVEAKRQHTT